MSRLINRVKDRNEEIPPSICSAILDCLSHIDENQESWCSGDFDQDSISPRNLNLTNVNPLTNWPFFVSMKLNLNVNVTPISNFVIQFQFLNLCWLWYPYPSWNQFQSQHLFLCP